MAARFDARVLLVAAGGADAFTHPQLHRRALERLGCQVDLVDLDYGHGWGRLLGIPTLAPRLRRAVARQEPELILVLDDLPLEADTVTALRARTRESTRERITPLRSEIDAVFARNRVPSPRMRGESAAKRRMRGPHPALRATLSPLRGARDLEKLFVSERFDGVQSRRFPGGIPAETRADDRADDEPGKGPAPWKDHGDVEPERDAIATDYAEHDPDQPAHLG